MTVPLASGKRPASTNVSVEANRANKRSKTMLDAATIHTIQERVNSAEADQGDSDDDFVGVFDDEIVESDEQEDEIDQDIVVSQRTPIRSARLSIQQPLDSPVVKCSHPRGPVTLNRTPTC